MIFKGLLGYAKNLESIGQKARLHALLIKAAHEPQQKVESILSENQAPLEERALEGHSERGSIAGALNDKTLFRIEGEDSLRLTPLTVALDLHSEPAVSLTRNFFDKEKT